MIKDPVSIQPKIKCKVNTKFFVSKMVVETPTLVKRLMWICNTLFHEAVAVVTVYILWIIFYNFHIDSEFTWHMALSTVAYVPLMAEAIVLFADDNVWSQAIPRTVKYSIHGALLFLSCALVTTGIALLINQDGGIFVKVHQWTGLVSWILVLASQILGLAAAKPQIFSKFIPPVYVKFCHILLGTIGYVFGMVSLGFGLYKRSFRFYTTEEARIFTVVGLGIITFWSLLAALKTCYRQIKSILS